MKFDFNAVPSDSWMGKSETELMSVFDIWLRTRCSNHCVTAIYLAPINPLLFQMMFLYPLQTFENLKFSMFSKGIDI